ncbi:MAG TPA: zinc-binding dehydrogenase, partial [Gemmatimonadales bacterium]|nr:zinc-binding dehydrogenase [Gemmatimonadales bacterium]
MRVLQIIEPGRPLAEAVVDDPVPGPGDIVVRVGAAGICRSDVHYRSGTRPVPGLPLVPGHEVAGTVAAVGSDVDRPAVGERVCLHYLTTCGGCEYCRRGAEQFCVAGRMIGLNREGGYAEAIVIPARNAFQIPDGVTTEAAAVMMCSTATSFHALRRARLGVGEAVAVFGAGGLGMSAVQLARAMGAAEVFAVDINPVKLRIAADLGAVPVDAAQGDPVAAIGRLSAGRGVDVALELVGSPHTMRQAVAALAPQGRAVAVGITHEAFGLDPFNDLVLREAEVVGSADHLASEIPILLEMARRGTLQFSRIVTQ